MDLTTPSRNGERDSGNNRDTGNVGRGEKDRREFRSTGDTTVSFYGTSFGSPLLPSRLVGEYLHHGLLGCRTPHPSSRGRYLSTSSLSPSSLSECTAVSVTAWRTLAPDPSPLAWVSADRYGDGSRAIRHGVPRRSFGLSIKRRRDYVWQWWSVSRLFPRSRLRDLSTSIARDAVSCPCRSRIRFPLARLNINAARDGLFRRWARICNLRLRTVVNAIVCSEYVVNNWYLLHQSMCMSQARAITRVNNKSVFG